MKQGNAEKFIFRRFAIITVLFVGILMAVLGAFYRVFQNQHRHVVMEMMDTANKNVEQLELLFDEHFKTLDGISREASHVLGESGSSVVKLLHQLSSYTDIYGMKRMGIVLEDGICYTTDYISEDVSFRQFYIEGMKGKRLVSDVLIDAQGEDKGEVIMFSVPIESRNKVIGVCFATYKLDDIRRELKLESYAQTGNYLIFNKEGAILATSKEGKYEDALKDVGERLDERELPVHSVKTLMLNRGFSEEDYAMIMQLRLAPSPDPVMLKDTNGWVYLQTITPGYCTTTWYYVSYIKSMNAAYEVESNKIEIFALLLMIFVFVAIAYSLVIWLQKKQAEQQQQEIVKASYRDRLTGDDNFFGFQYRLSHQELKGYVICMDIRSFNVVNTVCGIRRGDEIIISLWRLVKGSLNEGEYACHVMGDAFAIFYHVDAENEESEKDQITARLMMLRQQILELSRIEDVPQMYAVFGAAAVETGYNTEEIYNRASIARQTMKKDAARYISFYAKVDESRLVKEREILDSFEHALNSGEFVPWYQPKFSNLTGRIVGAEALVRWVKPNGQMVPPSEFISILERNGRIAELDSYIFEQVVCRQKAWEQSGGAMIPISVNLSRASLYHEDLVEKYKQILKEHELSSEYVPIEITESAFADTEKLKKFSDIFNASGFALHMDDFGSGYSSLSDLGSMHFQYIKLDKGLVDQIGTAYGEKVLRHTIQLAREMNIEMVAEGVETREQVEFLKQEGLEIIQGYYYSKPMPLSAFNELCSQYVQSRNDAPEIYLMDRYYIQGILGSEAVSNQMALQIVGAMGMFTFKNGRITLRGVNEQLLEIIGLDVQSIRNREIQDITGMCRGDSADKLILAVQHAESHPLSGASESIIIELRNGTRKYLHVKIFFVRNKGKHTEFFAYVRDDTIKYFKDETLDSLPGGVVIYSANAEETLLYANKRTIEIYGCSDMEDFRRFTGNSFRGMVHPEELDWVEASIKEQIADSEEELDCVIYRIRKKDGTIGRVYDYGRLVNTEAMGAVFFVFISNALGQEKGDDAVGKVHELESRLKMLEYNSTHDGLTGLINQATARLQVQNYLDTNPNGNYALMVFDIDDFKKVNDNYGHNFGDRVLQSVSERISYTFDEVFERNTGIRTLFACRIGGDEFLMMFDLGDESRFAGTGKTAAEVLVEQVRSGMNWYVDSNHITTSAGIATTAQTSRAYREMFLSADMALYQTKRNGKNGVTLFQDGKALEDLAVKNEPELPMTAESLTVRKKQQIKEKLKLDDIYDVINLTEDLTEDYMFVVDVEHDFFYIAPKAAKHFDMESNAFYKVREGHKQFIFESDYNSFIDGIEQQIENREDRFCQIYRWKLKHGGIVWVKATGQIIRKQGHIVYLLGSIHEMNRQELMVN